MDESGRAAFNIAIRTAALAGVDAADGDGFEPGATLDWSVGAGIVADSEPKSEWVETLDKAAVVMGMGSRESQARGSEDRGT